MAMFVVQPGKSFHSVQVRRHVCLGTGIKGLAGFVVFSLAGGIL